MLRAFLTLLVVLLIAGLQPSTTGARTAGLPILPHADPARDLRATVAQAVLEWRLATVGGRRWINEGAGTFSLAVSSGSCAVVLGAGAGTLATVPRSARAATRRVAVRARDGRLLTRVPAGVTVRRADGAINAALVLRLPRGVLRAYPQRNVVVGVGAFPVAGDGERVAPRCRRLAGRLVRRIISAGSLRVTGRYAPPLPADPAPLIDLRRTPRLTIVGSGRDDRFGTAVVAPGDMTGDGHPDLAVLARSRSRIDVLALGTGRGTIDTRSTVPALRIDEVTAFASFAAIGDVDGDGLADLALGLPGLDEVPGSVRIVHGSATPRRITTADQTASRLIARGPSPCFGSSIAPAGDFDADGRPDLVVASPTVCAMDGAARVDVLPIPAGDEPIADLDAVSIRIRFADDTDVLTVRGAGDVNGDGLDDVVVGSSGYDAPRTSVVFGARAPRTVTFERPGADGITLAGVACAGLGQAVAPAGDFNGDGLGDVLVTAPETCDDGPAVTGAFVLLGGGAARLSVRSRSRRVVRIDGFETRLPPAVAPAGDVDADGLDDVLVSDGPTAYLVRGRRATTPISLQRLGTTGLRYRAGATIAALATVTDPRAAAAPKIAFGVPDARFAGRGPRTGMVIVR